MSPSSHSVQMDGVFTPRVPATLAAKTTFANVAIDFSGNYLYLTSGYPGSTVSFSGNYLYLTSGYPGSTVSQYAVGVDGTLTPLAQPTVASGSGPNAIVTVKK
jgi:hypothetical protein